MRMKIPSPSPTPLPPGERKKIEEGKSGSGGSPFTVFTG